jgi:hypothetical protein
MWRPPKHVGANWARFRLIPGNGIQCTHYAASLLALYTSAGNFMSQILGKDWLIWPYWLWKIRI